MSKKTHQRELERARAKRQAEAYERRQKRTKMIAMGVIFAMGGAVVVGAALSTSGGNEPEVAIDDPLSDDGTTGQTTPDAVEAPCPSPVDPPTPAELSWPEPPDMIIDPDVTYTATMRTTCGDIEIELFAADAPITVNSFVFLAEQDYYVGVPFHRTIQYFMIQGGDPTGTGSGGPGYQFEDELDSVAKYGMEPGILAMANSGPNTNGSQFFIVHGDASHLTTHTVFGRVVEGMDIVDMIARGPVGGPRGDSAIDPVIILDVEISPSPSEA